MSSLNQICKRNVSQSTVAKLQSLSEASKLPLDIINFCVKPYLEHQIFVVVELDKHRYSLGQPEKWVHKFPLHKFEELAKTKPQLLTKIINSNMASFKVIKNKFTYYVSHKGADSPVDFINTFKQLIHNHDLAQELFPRDNREIAMDLD